MVEDIIAILKAIILILAFCFSLVCVFWVTLSYVGLLSAAWTGWSVGSVMLILAIAVVDFMAIVGGLRLVRAAARWWLGG